MNGMSLNLRAIAALWASAAAMNAAVPAADSARGARLFQSQFCVQCHPLNGVGPKVGPDLGRLVDRGFTPASLASILWNHAPTMLGALRERNIQPAMDEQAAADLFAFFYSTRFFEEPGDAGRGKGVFTSRGCAQCHGLADPKLPAARPVSQWTALTDPMALIEAMWDHASEMRDEMTRQKIAWPTLAGQDFADLVVYLRNLPSTQKPAAKFETLSGDDGKAVFDSKGCAQCHKSAESFLSSGLPGLTMTDVAAQMWNHGREMSGAGIQFAQGEMRQIASYIWSRRMFENSGKPGSGKTVFRRDCGSCHAGSAGGAPALTPGGHEYTDIFMVSAVWKHGSAINTSGKNWPRLDSREMSDLIAYLNNGVPK